MRLACHGLDVGVEPRHLWSVHLVDGSLNLGVLHHLSQVDEDIWVLYFLSELHSLLPPFLSRSAALLLSDVLGLLGAAIFSLVF